MNNEKSKDLSELAEEYRSAAEIVSGRIESRRCVLKTVAYGTKEAGILRDEINVLYRERADALATADALSGYYREKSHVSIF